MSGRETRLSTVMGVKAGHARWGWAMGLDLDGWWPSKEQKGVSRSRSRSLDPAGPCRGRAQHQATAAAK
jgi:hypothetical protein